MTIKKSEIESAIATTVICILILLLLIFCGITAHRNEMDEGVMISLGYAEDGFGEHVPNPEPAVEQAPAPTPSTPTPPPASPNVTAPSEEDLMTQEDPSVALEAEKKRKEEAELAKMRAEQERIEQERLEQERIEQERLEKERIEREKAAEAARIKAEQQAAAKNRANQLAGSAFQNMGKGQGTTKGDTQQGNPAGKGSQGGHSWSLNGRNLLGHLAQPSYRGNEEGKIVVGIRVDASGKVTSAEIAKGTTITNEALRNEAIAAARRNRFSTGGGIAIGTITYNFRLN